MCVCVCVVVDVLYEQLVSGVGGIALLWGSPSPASPAKLVYPKLSNAHFTIIQGQLPVGEVGVGGGVLVSWRGRCRKGLWSEFSPIIMERI